MLNVPTDARSNEDRLALLEAESARVADLLDTLIGRIDGWLDEPHDAEKIRAAFAGVKDQP
jgi:hypothetical protein